MSTQYRSLDQEKSEIEPERLFHRGWLFFTIAWAVLLTAVSQIPGRSFPQLSLLSHDKLIHISIYIPLGFGAMGAIFHGWRLRLAVCLLFIGVFGCSDEVHQHFVPGRYSSVFDWYADIVGGTIGAGLYYLWDRWHSGPTKINRRFLQQ